MSTSSRIASRRGRVCRRLASFVLWTLPLAGAAVAGAATLPAGFSETQLASGLASPTAMAIAPDGRIFVCEQSGRLRVIKNGALLPTPFLTVTVSSVGERGLLGVAFDPDFATNRFVYVYYTATAPAIHNRISRFTASAGNPDLVTAGSEVQIFNLPNLSAATNHNGGAIHFGPDGMLYVAVGENANGANAPSLNTTLGKILRINKDGTIPSDNPFFTQTTGNNRAIWARGVRNPFTFAFQPGTGRMHINDVGENTWEEVDRGIAGANYGWPSVEGPQPPGVAGITYPIHSYQNAGANCAIVGSAFYNPPVSNFPAAFAGRYFFGDFCGGFIRTLNPPDYTSVSNFATGIDSLVDIAVGLDGALYYLARGTGSVFRVQFDDSAAPAITQQPADQTVAVGQSATFQVAASGVQPIRFQWRRNGVDIPGATASTFTIASATLNDNGALFSAVATNDFGSATSNFARLTVVENRPPTATITAPATGTLYSGGQTFTFSGTGSDPETGTLPPGAFTWQIDFHHDDPHASLHAAHERDHERDVHDCQSGRDVGERVLPRDSDGARSRGLHQHDVQRPAAANVHHRPGHGAPRPPGDARRAAGHDAGLGPQRRGGDPYAWRRVTAVVGRQHLPIRVLVRRGSGDARDRHAGGRYDVHGDLPGRRQHRRVQ